MSDWRPISEAPLDGRRVLVFQPPGIWEVAVFSRYDHSWVAAVNHPLHPTHWMPLPEPPADET